MGSLLQMFIYDIMNYENALQTNYYLHCGALNLIENRMVWKAKYIVIYAYKSR